MQFNYTAYNKDKRLVRGTLESVSMESAEQVLYHAGYERIIRLQSAGWLNDWQNVLTGPPKVGKQVLLDFTNELAIMLEAGLSLQTSLKQMERQASNRGLRTILPKISSELKAGSTLHAALAAYPQIFSQTYISMIESNEKSGTLDEGLRQIAAELKQDVDTRAKVQQALMQPAIIIVVALGALLIMTLYVLPKLTSIFQQFHAALPLPTRILMGLSSFIGDNKYYLLAAILVILLGGFTLSRSPSGKQYLDRLMLRLPLFGEVILWQNTARFSRTLSNLLKAGILLPDAMTIFLRGVGNIQIRAALTEVRAKLIQGQTLSAALSSNNLFPRFLVEMVSVGESSGQLEMAMGSVADYFEAKVTKRITHLTGMLEPALILGIGIVVGFVAIAMITTIYGMLGSIK